MKPRGLLSCLSGVAFAVLCLAVAPAQPFKPTNEMTLQRPLLVDTTWHEDFEGGSCDGWGSYPEFEDTAYDFTLLNGQARSRYHRQGMIASGEFFYPANLAPSQSSRPNQHFLLRAYRPNSASPQRIGVMRPLNLHMSSGFKITFEYWLKQQTVPCELQLELLDARGDRYRSQIGHPATGAWTILTLPGNDFKRDDGAALPPDTRFEALAIMACYPEGDAGSYHYLAVDNLAITSRRQAGFELISPQVESYTNWVQVFSRQHFKPGDVLKIEARPEQPVDSVTATLSDWRDKVLAEGELTPRAGVWSIEALHTFRATDPAGPLWLELKGLTADNSFATTKIRLWHFKPEAPPHAHPRLFFDASQVAELKQRATRPGRGANCWKEIEARARSARAKPTPADGQIELLMKDYLLQDIGPYFKQLRDNGTGALNNALVFAIMGDVDAGRHAKDSLLKMCGWTQWVHPWFQTQGRRTYYPVGIAAMELGMTYDLIYDLLSPDERRTVRAGLLRNGIEPAYREYFVENRIPTNTSNWISHSTAGPMIALLAMAGDEDPNNAGQGIEPYFSGLAEKFLALLQYSFLPDGSYGEGYAYQNFTLETATPALAALQHMFGITGLEKFYHLDRSYLFAQYISVDHGRLLLDMGDSHDERHGASPWAWLAANSSDTLLRSFYATIPGNLWPDFLFANDSLTTTPPTSLPPSRVFEAKGNAVFRTGWDDQAVILNLRAGPNFNHTHFDQGGFRLRAFGEELISEAGPSDYYDDPYYWSFFTQAAGHNTVLINDNPESQEAGDIPCGIKALTRHAKLQGWLVTPGFNAARAELGMLYRGELKSFERQLVMPAPGYVLVRDELQATSAPLNFQWQLFPPSKTGVTIKGNSAVYEGKLARLKLEVHQPADADLRMLDTPIPYAEYQKYPVTPLVPRAVLQVLNRQPATQLNYLVALLPELKTTSTADALHTSEVAVTGGAGLAVTGPGFRHLHAWRSGESMLKVENFEVDGASLFANQPAAGQPPRQIAAMNMRQINYAGRTLLRSEEYFNASVEFDDQGETWTLQLSEPSPAFFPSSPKKFRLIEGDVVQLNAPVDPMELHFESLSAKIRLERP